MGGGKKGKKKANPREIKRLQTAGISCHICQHGRTCIDKKKKKREGKKKEMEFTLCPMYCLRLVPTRVKPKKGKERKEKRTEE